MAPRRPSVPLRRGPQSPGGFVLPARARSSRATSSAFPLFPMLAAAFLMLGAAQLAFWWWEARLPTVPERQRATGGSFSLNTWWKDEPATAQGQVRQVQRMAVPVRPENLQFGDAVANVVVTVFTDPACGLCREQVRQWTAGLPAQGVKIVYKFWPSDTRRKTPGMLVELARRQAVAGAFWRSVQEAGVADLDDAALLTMLERAGVPLAEQRAALTDETSPLMIALEPDLKAAREANLPPPPVVLVDDYVLDGVLLKPERLGTYVRKRLDGLALFERDDLWLMRK